MRESETRAGEHLSDPGKEARRKAGIPVVPVFDGYRTYAILGVVLLHLVGRSGLVGSGDTSLISRLTWATIGHSIEVLFIVSGFVVYLPMAFYKGSPGNLRAYSLRRVSRLFPAYWLILALILLLIAVTTDPPLPMPGMRDLIANLTALHVPLGLPISGISSGFGANSAIWTLSVEVCFYLLLPLVAGFYFRRPWMGLILAALLTVAWNESFRHPVQISEQLNLGLDGLEALRLATSSTLQLPAWAFSFALGMTGAWLFLQPDRIPGDRERVIRIAKYLTLLGFVFFAWRAGLESGSGPFEFVAQQGRSDPILAIGYSGTLGALMILVALQPGRIGALFSNPPVRKLADISYGIFLSHVVIITFVGPLLGLPRDGTLGAFIIWCLVVVPTSILYGYLSARFLEQPIRRWARRYGRRDAA